ncbi:MAG: VOC family protein [Oscillospiraceae bacterium]|nr:VOC family protein [Oscillospiraceae bacterium]
MNIIHHIAIICSDKDKALDFYVDKLGFSIIRENYRPEREDWKIDLKINNDTELELFIMKNHPKRLSPESYGLRHIAFKVDDVDSAVKELEAKGIICEPVRTDEFSGGKATFFKDPDGLPIEIHE